MRGRPILSAERMRAAEQAAIDGGKSVEQLMDRHIITEGEKRGDDSAEDHSHTYDLRDPLPATLANQELQFFLGRLAQDLVEMEPEPEIPPGEEEGA